MGNFESCIATGTNQDRFLPFISWSLNFPDTWSASWFFDISIEKKILIVVNKTTIIPFTLYLTVVSVLHVELDTRGISILHIKDVMVIRKLDTPFRTLRNKDMDHKFESMQFTRMFWCLHKWTCIFTLAAEQHKTHPQEAKRVLGTFWLIF